jgi:hypothetical protein
VSLLARLIATADEWTCDHSDEDREDGPCCEQYLDEYADYPDRRVHYRAA